MSLNIRSSLNSHCFLPMVNRIRMSLLHIAISDCIFFNGLFGRFVKYSCNALKALFLATKGIATRKRSALKVFLPLLVILVCPLCFPDVFSLRLSPANLIICLGGGSSDLDLLPLKRIPQRCLFLFPLLLTFVQRLEYVQEVGLCLIPVLRTFQL